MALTSRKREMHTKMINAARIGAFLYVIWGALHLLAAFGIYKLALTLPDGLARGRLVQGAFDLGVFALQAIAVAVILNWRNNHTGYWFNAVVVGIVDLAFIVLLIVPGYVAASLAAFAGPAIYVIATIFSTVGVLRKREGVVVP